MGGYKNAGKHKFCIDSEIRNNFNNFDLYFFDARLSCRT